MDFNSSTHKKSTEVMSDRSFRTMTFIMNAIDLLCPYIDKRIRQFGIKEGMFVVDYGCGPGRYTMKFAKLVGERGKVYALDIHKLAINAVRRKIIKHKLKNIEPILIDGYNSTLPNDIADIVCAIDMFLDVEKPTALLEEIRRITKKDGILIIDGRFEPGNRQPPSAAKQKILDSELWDIIEETGDHLKCRPRNC